MLSARWGCLTAPALSATTEMLAVQTIPPGIHHVIVHGSRSSAAEPCHHLVPCGPCRDQILYPRNGPMELEILWYEIAAVGPRLPLDVHVIEIYHAARAMFVTPSKPQHIVREHPPASASGVFHHNRLQISTFCPNHTNVYFWGGMDGGADDCGAGDSVGGSAVLPASACLPARNLLLASAKDGASRSSGL